MSNQKVYHMPMTEYFKQVRWRSLTIVLLILVVVAALQTKSLNVFFLFVATLAICLSLVTLLLFFVAWRSRLVITAEGITAYHGSGPRRQDARWDNIVGIEQRTVRDVPLRGLVTHYPVYDVGGWHTLLGLSTAVRTLRDGPREIGGAIREWDEMDVFSHFIPIELYVQDWTHSPLLDDIRQYAPQAFQPEAKATPQNLAP